MEEIKRLRPGPPEDVDLDSDPILESFFMAGQRGSMNLVGPPEESDASLDLVLACPRAIDILKFYTRNGRKVPARIAASLGPNIPVLLTHVLTPFPGEGKSPCQIWSLGYEFSVGDANLQTVSVAPNDEVYKIANVEETVKLGLQLGGGAGVPDGTLQVLNTVPGIKISGAKVEASTSNRFEVSIKLPLTLREVTGAPMGTGGARWQMWRQDEALDRPHTLLQTIMVTEGTKHIRCTIKTWAKQAGFLGLNSPKLGAKLWRYPNQTYVIDLAGLSPAPH